eukprot:TRINITY_DN7487_c0_g2_i1.p1 TRINITY_DN7487_c0_g2~~TRINITY_DN7487_c0_g2_i1.p1  ORF type:complete len:312 (-),score=75.47 TRINITY_DN7487_c0_g2_i1:157-1092(-)
MGMDSTGSSRTGAGENLFKLMHKNEKLSEENDVLRKDQIIPSLSSEAQSSNAALKEESDAHKENLRLAQENIKRLRKRIQEHQCSSALENSFSTVKQASSSSGEMISVSKSSKRGGRCSISDEFKNEGLSGAPLIGRESDPADFENEDLQIIASANHKSHSQLVNTPPKGEDKSIQVEDKCTQTSMMSGEDEIVCPLEVSEVLESILDGVVRSSEGHNEEDLGEDNSDLRLVPRSPVDTLILNTCSLFNFSLSKSQFLIFLLFCGLFCLFCTVFGCIKIGHKTLYPRSWSSHFPEPFIILWETSRGHPTVW